MLLAQASRMKHRACWRSSVAVDYVAFPASDNVLEEGLLFTRSILEESGAVPLYSRVLSIQMVRLSQVTVIWGLSLRAVTTERVVTAADLP